MGKSTYIKDKTQGFELVDLFLSGELTDESLAMRLDDASKQARDKNKLAINIKLDFIEDFSVRSQMVDYVLFCISIVNRYYSDKGCRDLRSNIKLIFFEIGNTFSTELLLELDTLRIFNTFDSQVVKGHYFKVVMPAFQLNSTFYDANIKSDQQVVGLFLQLVDSNCIQDSTVSSIT